MTQRPDGTGDGAPSPSLQELAYGIAYRLLPYYAFEQADRAEQLFRDRPEVAGPLFYAMACKAMGVAEPRREDAERFRTHVGALDERRRYLCLAFPEPPPFDLAGVPPGAIERGEVPVLAPHFSAIVRGGAGGDAYFVLGQAPLGGGTTLRRLTADGVNANLGPGPRPELAGFLDAVRQRPS